MPIFYTTEEGGEWKLWSKGMPEPGISLTHHPLLGWQRSIDFFLNPRPPVHSLVVVERWDEINDWTPGTVSWPNPDQKPENQEPEPTRYVTAAEWPAKR